MRPCRVCAQPLLWGGDKLRGICHGCELRAPQSEPVEGPMGDPQAPAEQGDPRAPTVPAPPPSSRNPPCPDCDTRLDCCRCESTVPAPPPTEPMTDCEDEP